MLDWIYYVFNGFVLDLSSAGVSVHDRYHSRSSQPGSHLAVSQATRSRTTTWLLECQQCQCQQHTATGTVNNNIEYYWLSLTLTKATALDQLTVVGKSQIKSL